VWDRTADWVSFRIINKQIEVGTVLAKYRVSWFAECFARLPPAMLTHHRVGP